MSQALIWFIGYYYQNIKTFLLDAYWEEIKKLSMLGLDSKDEWLFGKCD
jgi:hypothetical protein